MNKFYSPILTCGESARFEADLLKGDTSAEFIAMSKAGYGIATSFLKEFTLPKNAKILVAVGNGHNGGDALIALNKIFDTYPDSTATIVISDENNLKPNTQKAFCLLKDKIPTLSLNIISKESLLSLNENFDLIIEGLVGMTFSPPARPELSASIDKLNCLNSKLKISIDIPAGASDTPQVNIFKADVTYATAIAKDVIFKNFNREYVGRIRFVDINFDLTSTEEYLSKKYFLANAEKLFAKLTQTRPSISDKRTFGHLFILAGSARYSGAALLNTRAALRSGVGLVTAFVPESFAPHFAAAEPSAMWVGCPEDEYGNIALESFGIIRERISRATAILIGSGLGDSNETQALVAEILKSYPDIPVVLDADAIRISNFNALLNRNSQVIATPHEGEILRIASDASDISLLDACKKYNATILLKSSATRISDGEKIIYSTDGSPALARAGSGDILGGLCGGLLASGIFQSPLDVASCASAWLGKTSVAIAKQRSEISVASSDFIDFLHIPLCFE